MAVPFPHIPENETVTELLDVLLNPAKFKERLEALKAWHDQIANMLTRYKEWGTIENASNKATSLMAEAKKVKKETDDYVREETQRVDNYHREAKEKADEILKKADEKEIKLDEREKALNQKDFLLLQDGERMAAKWLEAEGMLAQALAAKGRAEKAEQDLNLKIAKIKEISAGE